MFVACLYLIPLMCTYFFEFLMVLFKTADGHFAKIRLIVLLLFQMINDGSTICVDVGYSDIFEISCNYTNITSSDNYDFKLRSEIPYTIQYPNQEFRVNLLVNSSNIDELKKGSFNYSESNISIETLNLIDCKINRINPFAFENFTSLYNLNISQNNLREIKRFTFNNLSRLKVLDLSFNNISLLSNESFENLPALETIDLSNNSISDISNELFLGLSSLKALNLFKNKIVSIEKFAFKTLKCIESIDLSYNQLKYLKPELTRGLNSLAKINYEYNFISEYDFKMFDNLTNIFSINLSHNNITNITLIISKPSFLYATIDLKYNKIRNLNIYSFQIHSELSSLILSHNFIGLLPTGVFGTLNFLDRLDVSFNNLAEITTGSLVGLHLVRELYLNDNKIRSISKAAFYNTPNLERLVIANNFVKVLDLKIIMQGTSLKYINFTYNIVPDCNDLISVIQYCKNNSVGYEKGGDNQNLGIQGMRCTEENGIGGSSSENDKRFLINIESLSSSTNKIISILFALFIVCAFVTFLYFCVYFTKNVWKMRRNTGSMENIMMQ